MPQYIETKKEKTGSHIPTVVGTVMPLLVGIGIAKAIFTFGASEKYEKKVKLVAEQETYWIYLALVVLGRMVALVNFMPTYYKNQIFEKGNIRANPFIFKALDGGHVTYEEDGAIGAYNRGNRSLQHMIETMPVLLAALFAVGQVLPFPALILVVVYVIGRISHSIGYSTKGYGGHAPGFLLSFLSVSVLEGLLAMIFFKAISF